MNFRAVEKSQRKQYEGVSPLHEHCIKLGECKQDVSGPR